jgi:hypothetical protein
MAEARRSEASPCAGSPLATDVTPDDILIVAESRDTSGNIWGNKRRPDDHARTRFLHDHGWGDVILVTSDWHVLFLAEIIWGPGYRPINEPIAGENQGR